MGYNKIFDILSIWHFILYYIVGLYIKNNYVLAFGSGMLWEIFEYIVTKNKYTRKLLIQYWPISQRIWDEDLFNQNRISDLIFNMLGYHLGNIRK